MIFRDDDISHTTDIALFRRVHKYFADAGITHTIALIVKDIETNHALVDYINTENIDVQLHCFTHYHLIQDPETFAKELPQCIKTIEWLFGKKPTILFPPWNETDETINIICANYGIRVSTEKTSLDRYILHNGNVKEQVINFHYWAQQETILIEPALKIYANSTNNR